MNDMQMDPDSLCPDVKFIEQMGSLLDDDEHCDVTFFVGPSKTEVGPGELLNNQIIEKSWNELFS